MNAKIKDIIKSIFYITIFFSMIIGLAIYLDDDKESQAIQMEQLFEKSNFPLSDYSYKKIPTHTAEKKAKKTFQENALSEINNKKKDAKSDISKKEKQKNSINNKYTMNIFKSEKKILEEKKIKTMNKRKKELLNIVNSDTSIKTPLENKVRGKKNSIDYGANKFSNEKERDLATHETKIYRTLTADKMISATLINSIHSTLSGQVVAQIDDDIYASMGDAILIPKGSRAIGYYTNNAPYGANRFALIWSRIITTNGNNIRLTSAQTADILGNSGIVGTINKKEWDRFGLPLMLSTLSNALLLQISKSKNGTDSTTEVILESSRSDLGYIMKTIIDEQIKIKPLITVKQGSKIFINPTVDIWFPKPKNKEIQAQYFRDKKE